MEITVTLSEFDIEVLEAYRILSNYEGYDLDLERFINTKDSNGFRYGDNLKTLLDTLASVLDREKSNSNTTKPSE